MLTAQQGSRDIEFGEFRISRRDQQLTRGGQVVPLKPKAYDLLLTLVDNRDRFVSKEELLNLLWPGTHVEEGSLTQAIYELRRAFSDDVRQSRYIATLSKRGYRFIGLAPVDEAAPRPRSIAVLPFRIVAAESEREFLQVGLTDAVITALTRVPSLVVRPTASVMRHRGERADAVEAGRALLVDLVLDGSIQVVHDRVRSNVRLIDVTTAVTRFATSFDEPRADLFSLQDSIAAGIVREITSELATSSASGGETPIRQQNAEAYELYLKGRYNLTKVTEEALRRSVDFFRASIAADPDFALAWVGLSDAYTSLDWYGVLSTRQSNPYAIEAARRAVDLDEKLGEARASLAMALQYAWEWRAAEAEYREAIRLSPNLASAHQRLAVLLAYLGRPEEALREIRTASRLDPVSPSIQAQRALVFICADRADDAAIAALDALTIEPESIEALFYLLIARVMQRRLEDALEVSKRLPPENPDFVLMQAHVLGAMGRRSDAEDLIRRVRAESHRHVPYFWLAIAEAGCGRFSDAAVSLEHACDEPDDSLLGIKVFPLLRPLYDHPGFRRVLERMHLPHDDR